MQRMMKIINADPILWMDDSHLPANVNEYKGVQRGVLNKMIIESNQFERLKDIDLNNDLARIICKNWMLMKDTIKNMVCYRHRSLISQSVTDNEISMSNRQFMSLNKTESGCVQVRERYRVNIDLLAQAEINTFRSELPGKILVKIAKMFPEQFSERELKLEFNHSIFIMALNHARLGQ